MARLFFALLALVALGASHRALAHKEAMTGGVRDAKTDDPHAVEAAMFAVDALNDGHKLRSELNDVGGLLTYVRVKDVRQQLVAGMLYFMTVVVTDSHGAEHEFTCKVWSRPWLKNANGGDQSMQLSDVKYVRPSASSA